MSAERSVAIIGAGLCGALLARLLAQRGYRVDVFERRGDPRRGTHDSGRSINLALAARGLRALDNAGIGDQLRPMMLPMRGRMIHPTDGTVELQPYGQSDAECIYSIGRAALNRLLIEAAARAPGVRLCFEHRFVDLDPGTLRLDFERPDRARLSHTAPITLATDGAGSAVRGRLGTARLCRTHEEWLDHDYKELTIPATAGSALARDALHIWPRGGYMLIALPNPDLSFTATLFLPRTGPVSFAALDSAARVEQFFAREFPDATHAMPALARDFFERSQGRMATVHCTPWSVGTGSARLLLLGDAAHAIVPFHGQGMNAAFEDCMELCERLDAGEPLDAACAGFEAHRRPQTEAIATMALENYVEMRDSVRDAGFVRRKSLAAELERRYPERFIPRYSMVMFHPEIPYAEAQRRGAIQTEILLELENGSLDASQAEAAILARLAPIRRLARA